MKLHDYLAGLTKPELAAYATRCGTTANYMNCHIKYARKEPRRALREALAAQSEGNVSSLEVLQHFGLAATPEAA